MNNFREIGIAAIERENFCNNTADPSGRLYKMIDYAKDRFHWYEDQREKKLTLAIGMVTVSGVSLSLIGNSLLGKGIDPTSIHFRLACLILMSVTFTSFGVMLTYLRGQNLIYTHRQGLHGIFSWYAYGVPPIDRVGLVEYFIFGRYSNLTLVDRAEPALAGKKRVLLDGYQKFAAGVVPRLNNLDLSIEEDLQQVYILQIFQVISQDNLQNMIACLKVGVLMIASFTIILAISIFAYGVSIPQAPIS